MLLTNLTSSEYYVGNKNYFLSAGGTLTIPDTVYNNDNAIANAANQLVATNKASASSTPSGFPRSTGATGSGGGTAATTTYSPTGTISAATVQAAIDEAVAEAQPLDADLTAIANLAGQQAYGRSVLTAANKAALAALAGGLADGAGGWDVATWQPADNEAAWILAAHNAGAARIWPLNEVAGSTSLLQADGGTHHLNTFTGNFASRIGLASAPSYFNAVCPDLNAGGAANDGQGNFQMINPQEDNMAHEFWVYRDTGGCIMSGVDGSFFSLRIYCNSDGSIEFRSHGGSSKDISSAGLVPVRTWTHVLAGRIGTVWKYFVNGALAQTGGTANPNSSLGKIWQLGGCPSTSEYFSGRVFNYAYYNVGPTLAIAQSLYTAATAAQPQWTDFSLPVVLGKTLTTKGDIPVGAGSSAATGKIAVGVNGSRLVADSTQTYGVKWKAEDGWTDAGETWTYTSVDGPTGVFSVNADVTAKYSVGMRVKYTQTTVKYGIITAVGAFSAGATPITVYGGTDYTLANAAITLPYWSLNKAPFGFPLSPAKWTVELVDANDRTQASPVAGTVYNLGTQSLSIPIGLWDLSFHINLYADSATSINYLTAQGGISTANNSFSDSELKEEWFLYNNAYSDTRHRFGISRRKLIALAAKTSYYLVASCSQSSGNPQTLTAAGSGVSPTVIRAVCAYL